MTDKYHGGIPTDRHPRWIVRGHRYVNPTTAILAAVSGTLGATMTTPVQVAQVIFSGVAAGTITFGASLTPGNTVVLVYSLSASSTVPSPNTPTSTAGTFVADSGALNSSGNQTIRYYRMASVTTGLISTIAVSTTANCSGVVAACELPGAFTLDNFTSLTTETSTPSISFSPAEAGEFYVAAMAISTSRSITGDPSSPWVSMPTSGESTNGRASYQLNSGSGSLTASWTTNASTTMVYSLCAWEPPAVSTAEYSMIL